MDSYEPVPETTFVGAEVAKGTAALLARYRRDYPDQDYMGTTEFSELEARPLSDDLAIVTGRYRLVRNEEYGGPAQGIFSLVMRKSDGRWRIIHDHTSRLP
jgi:ketosteroid isomerase-like protein